MQEVTRRAAERGELDNSAVTPRRLEVGQAMLRQHFFFNGAPVPDSVIVEIVDEVLVPLFAGSNPELSRREDAPLDGDAAAGVDPDGERDSLPAVST